MRPCYFCGQPLEESYRVCTQCGRANRTPRQVRILGWVLLGLGAFLVVFMGGLTVVVGGVIAQSGNPEATHRFTGDRMQAAMMFGVFGVIALFGLGTAVAGALQIRQGRANARVLSVVLLLGGAIFVSGGLVAFFF